MMTRRAVTTALTCALTGRAAMGHAATETERLWSQAYIFGLPLLEMAATRQRALAAGARLNHWGHRSSLVDAKARTVTTPNNDTLYSSCWLDLSSPVTLSLPPASGRYQSIALMDAYTNVFHIAHAGDAPMRILGPTTRAARRMGDVLAPTAMVWALARTYVADAADLPAAKAAQRTLRVEAQDADAAALALAARPEPARSAGWDALSRIQSLIGENPPPRRDATFLRTLRHAGLGPGQDGLMALDERAKTRLAAAIDTTLASLRAGVDGVEHRGWTLPPRQLGRYGQDYRLRAATALAGLGALPPEEARYLIARHDLDGAPLLGARGYSLTFAPHAWPPGVFWSLTLYEKTPDGQLFFFDNDQGRYALGPGKSGFYGLPDRPLTLKMAHATPEGSPVNWLPAPAGPFEVQLRLYRPSADWSPPALAPL